MVSYPSRHKLTTKLWAVFEVSIATNIKDLWKTCWEASSTPNKPSALSPFSGMRQTTLINPFLWLYLSSQSGMVSRKKRRKDSCLLLVDKYCKFMKNTHRAEMHNCFIFSQTFIQIHRKKNIFIHVATLLEAVRTLHLIKIPNISFVSSIPTSNTAAPLLFALYFCREDYLILLRIEHLKHE